MRHADNCFLDKKQPLRTVLQVDYAQCGNFVTAETRTEINYVPRRNYVARELTTRQDKNNSGHDDSCPGGIPFFSIRLIVLGERQNARRRIAEMSHAVQTGTMNNDCAASGSRDGHAKINFHEIPNDRSLLYCKLLGFLVKLSFTKKPPPRG